MVATAQKLRICYWAIINFECCCHKSKVYWTLSGSFHKKNSLVWIEFKILKVKFNSEQTKVEFTQLVTNLELLKYPHHMYEHFVKNHKCIIIGFRALQGRDCIWNECGKITFISLSLSKWLSITLYLNYTNEKWIWIVLFCS